MPYSRPKKRPEKVVVAWSGGKDSTALLLGLKERSARVDEVISFSSSWEWPIHADTLEKLKKITGYKFTVLTPPVDFDEMLLNQQSIVGGKAVRGLGWPIGGCRWCTRTKGRTIDKYRRNSESVLLMGINADEAGRSRRRSANSRHWFEYPLVEWGIGHWEGLLKCKQAGIDFGGYYDRGFQRLSCWCCPLQSKLSLYILRADFPKMWEKFKMMNSLTWNKLFLSSGGFEGLEIQFDRVRDAFASFVQGDVVPVLKIRKEFRWLLKCRNIPIFEGAFDSWVGCLESTSEG